MWWRPGEHRAGPGSVMADRHLRMPHFIVTVCLYSLLRKREEYHLVKNKQGHFVCLRRLAEMGPK